MFLSPKEKQKLLNRSIAALSKQQYSRLLPKRATTRFERLQPASWYSEQNPIPANIDTFPLITPNSLRYYETAFSIMFPLFSLGSIHESLKAFISTITTQQNTAFLFDVFFSYFIIVSLVRARYFIATNKRAQHNSNKRRRNSTRPKIKNFQSRK